MMHSSVKSDFPFIHSRMSQPPSYISGFKTTTFQRRFVPGTLIRGDMILGSENRVAVQGEMWGQKHSTRDEVRNYHARVTEGVDRSGDVTCDVGKRLRNSNRLEVPQKWTS